jgi:ActR/RegA family two-component response regulator
MTAVLIVEDDQMLGRAVYRDLTEYGFNVQIAGGYDEAIEILRQGPIDVLLTDLRLGSADGIDLLESVRHLQPRTRAVLMSGFASARDYQRAVELGVVRVLCKPFTRADLIQCIRQAIDCETGFRGSIHGLSLIDVLQMFNLARRSIAISVSGQSPGQLFFRDGQLVHAEHHGRIGEGALASILAMAAGSLSTSVVPETIPQSIQRDFRQVLFDALRFVDETLADNDLDDVLDHAVASASTLPVIEPRPTLDLAPARPRQASPVELSLLDEDEGEADLQGEADLEGEADNSRGARAVLDCVRTIDGYVAACLILSDSGKIIAHDGQMDLRPAANLTAALVRHNSNTISALTVNDETEDVLITATTQYHLLRAIDTAAPTFVHVVLDRRTASPAMAKLTLATAVRAYGP